MDVPLESEVKETVNDKGTEISVKALDKFWAIDVEYPTYKYGISRESSEGKMAEPESLLDFVRSCYWLLSLPFNEFWSQILFGPDVFTMLDSYLEQSPRPFEVKLCGRTMFADNKRIAELEMKVHKAVLLILIRMGNSKENDTNYISDNYHRTLLTKNKLFTVPRLFDICAVYGASNRKLIQELLSKLLADEPAIDRLRRSAQLCTERINGAVEELGKVCQRRKNALNNTNPVGDVLTFLADFSFTLAQFFDCYPGGCKHFYSCDILPSLQEVFTQVSALYSHPNYGHVEFVRSAVPFVQYQVVHLYQRIVAHVVLDPLFLNNNPSVDALRTKLDEYFNLLTHALDDKEFFCALNSVRSLEEDFAKFASCSQLDNYLDPSRIAFFLGALTEDEQPSNGLFESRSGTDSKAEINGSKGTVQDYAAAVVNVDFPPSVNSSAGQDVEMSSMVSHIKEMLFLECSDNVIKDVLIRNSLDVDEAVNWILENGVPDEKEKPESIVETNGYQAFSEFPGTSGADIEAEDFFVPAQRLKRDKLEDILEDRSHLAPLEGFYQQYTFEPSSDEEEYPGSRADVIPKINNVLLLDDDEYDDTYDIHDVGASDALADEQQRTRRDEDLSSSAHDGSRTKPSPKGQHRYNQNRGSKESTAVKNMRTGSKNESHQNPPPSDNNRSKNVDYTGGDRRQYKDRHRAQVANHNRKKLAARKNVW